MTPHADTEQLSAYLDGEVPGSERAVIEQHLTSCSECSAKKAALEGVIRSVHNLPTVAATDAEHAALRRAVLDGAGAGGRVATLSRARAWRVFGATAGVAALLAGIVAFALVRAEGPKVGPTAASLAAPSASPPPDLNDDAAVRSYAASLSAVSAFLGQIHASPAQQVPAAAQAAPDRRGAQGVASPPAAFGAAPPLSGTPPVSGTANRVNPATLASCTRDAVPTGAALITAVPVFYRGAPAWAIAYGASSTTAGTLDRVIVEVRSQSACALLDQSTLIP